MAEWLRLTLCVPHRVFSEILGQSEPPDAPLLSYIMHLLAVEEIDGLPPGGGLSAKYALHAVFSPSYSRHTVLSLSGK